MFTATGGPNVPNNHHFLSTALEQLWTMSRRNPHAPEMITASVNGICDCST